MPKLLFIHIFFISFHCFTQPVHTIKILSNLQAVDDPFYNDGLFPSRRFLGKGKNAKEDNNIYFTAITVYTLKSLRDHLSESDKILVDAIIAKATANYPLYKNRNGDITYNFWQTSPEMPFPNSKHLSKSNRMKLPDDLDDTSIIYLTLDNTLERSEQVKQKMADHSNTTRVKSTFRRYRNFQGYLSWFGERIKQDLDVCVMSNVLLFAFQKQLKMNETDGQTIQLIKEILDNDDHLKNPHIVSPWYQNSSIILYHLARLISVADDPTLSGLRGKIVADIKKHLQRVEHEMEKMILFSTLLRLGEPLDSDMNIDDEKISANFEDFYWFRVNFFSGKGMFVKKLIGKSGAFQYKYTSEAYYVALLLEFQVLSASYGKVARSG